MTEYDKAAINCKTTICHLLRRFCTGASAVKNNLTHFLIFVIYVIVSGLVLEFRGSIFGLGRLWASYVHCEHYVGNYTAVLYSAGTDGAVCAYGNSGESISACEAFQSIGFVNNVGESPVLVGKHKDKENPRLTIWEFAPVEFPWREWEDKQPGLKLS